MSRWNKDVPVGNRFVMELPLLYTDGQRTRLDTIFRIANNIENLLIGWYKNRLNEMTRTRKWRNNQKSMYDLHNEYDSDLAALQKLHRSISARTTAAKKRGETLELSNKDKKRLDRLEQRAADFQKKYNPLIAVRNEMINAYGFNLSRFEQKEAIYRKCYDTLVGADIGQKIATKVWAMFEAYLFKRGKKISFSKNEDFLSIEGKTNRSGIRFDRDSMTVALGKKSNAMVLKVKLNKKDPYAYERIAIRKDVSFCRIIRKAYPEGWRYFLQLTLKGEPPIKVDRDTGEVLHSMGRGRVGLDIGPRTLAYCADTAVSLVELAQGLQNMENELRRVNRAMDRSRKATNPKMFKPDGTVVRINNLPPECLNRRGRRRWSNSRRYWRLTMRRRALYRKQAALRKHLHRRLANLLLPLGDKFFVEDMRWRALARRSKKTRKNKKGKNLSKKRYGKSIANKAPGLFLSVLEKKVLRYGGSFNRIITWEAKASQFDHMTGKYKPKKLSQRWHIFEDGTKVQRDLYSAFLIKNTKRDLKTFNDKVCKKEFPAFLAMHNKVIKALQEEEATLPSSMGIKKSSPTKRAA